MNDDQQTNRQNKTKERKMKMACCVCVYDEKMKMENY